MANSQLIYTSPEHLPWHSISDQPIHLLFALTFTQSTQKEKRMNNHTFSYALVKKKPSPWLGFSLGRKRQRLQGRRRKIRVPRWFRKNPRVEYLIPHIWHARKTPMDAVCELLRVRLLLRCQQFTLPDGIQRCMGVLPVIWHPCDVDHCDWNLLHGAGHFHYQIEQPQVMVQVQRLAVVLIRKRLLYASDPLGVSPILWTVFTRKEEFFYQNQW